TATWSTFVRTDPIVLNLQAGVQVLRVTYPDDAGDTELIEFGPKTGGSSNTPPIVSSPLADVSVEAGASVSVALAGVFSDADAGDTLTYSLSGEPAWLSIQSGSITGTAGAAGTHTITVTASDGTATVDDQFTLTVTDPAGSGQSPYGGTPWVLSAASGLQLEPTVYDEGGQGVAYNDVAGRQGGDTGYRPSSDVESVGDATDGALVWVQPGDWVEYTIDVEEAGTYPLEFLAASARGPVRIQASVEQGGTFYESGEVTAPGTATWSTFVRTDPIVLNLQAEAAGVAGDLSRRCRRH
ncbi:MAG: putative Ig domain-containing protein, partial [Pseudomonadota bacterium]